MLQDDKKKLLMASDANIMNISVIIPFSYISNIPIEAQ